MTAVYGNDQSMHVRRLFKIILCICDHCVVQQRSPVSNKHRSGRERPAFGEVPSLTDYPF